MAKILLIEDDFLYSEELKFDLTDYFAGASIALRIDVISTEREFSERFEEIAKTNYDLIIVDVMVKWEGREREKKRPDSNVLEGGYYRAGFRCIDRLRADTRSAETKILVHSNLDKRFMGDFQEKHENECTRFVPKSGSPEPLLDVLRQWIPVKAPEPATRD